MALKRTGSSTALEDSSTDTLGPPKGKRLRIWIPCNSEITTSSPKSVTPDGLSALSSPNSLFDETDDAGNIIAERPPASSTAPSSIEGLYFDPTLLLSETWASKVMDFCRKTYFHTPGANQVMLFGRFDPTSETKEDSSSTIGFPPILLTLLDTLAEVLRPSLPEETYNLLFPSTPTQARQAIINLYHPGEGITPHVDLLGRYADGIIGVSFGSGCVMRFDQVNPSPPSSPREAPPARHDLYLPERSVLVLSKDARYNWTHGIDKWTCDYVLDQNHDENHDPVQGDLREEGRWLERRTRLSVTFRWMLPGADIVGAHN